jgi:hypothetical protein
LILKVSHKAHKIDIIDGIIAKPLLEKFNQMSEKGNYQWGIKKIPKKFFK